MSSYAGSLHDLMVLRFFQGIGTGAVMIAGRAMTSDLFQGLALKKQMTL